MYSTCISFFSYDVLHLSLSLTLQSNYYDSHIREAPAAHHQQQQPSSASISTIHHTQVQSTSEVLALTRQDSPDSGFGNGEPQNSPLNPQNSPMVAQQQSPPAVVSQQNSPLMTQQHSPMMAQQGSPQMQNSPLGSEPQQPLQSLQSAISTCSLSKYSYPIIYPWEIKSLSIHLLLT